MFLGFRVFWVFWVFLGFRVFWVGLLNVFVNLAAFMLFKALPNLPRHYPEPESPNP